MRGLIWFKKDLRTLDQPALYHATNQCQEGVLALYLIDQNMWQAHHTSHAQIAFIQQGLQLLKQDLNHLQIHLVIHALQSKENLAEFILKLCVEHKIEAVFFNREYEVDEKNRDKKVTQLLMTHHIQSFIFEDQLIFPPEKLFKTDNDYFKVFTPFKKHWLQIAYQLKIKLTPHPKKVNPLKILSSEKILDGKPNTLWPAGEKAARQRLKLFIKKHLTQYDQERDFPFLNATSQLSPYLAVGMISARECFMEALSFNSNELDSGNKGALTWMSELIWRDFYRMILIAVPRVCKNKAYKLETEQLPWLYDTKLLSAWQEGQTGFPFVDAAMRQLNQTSWMHNRLRMVTAMFLSKNLFLDWRLGETYFAEKLIDFDFASNNGGWQWSASTGTDAVPYFRLFNPTTQGERFDPQGDFIRHYCPELKDCPTSKIHAPFEKGFKSNYPKPIIDYKKSRALILKMFQKIKKI